jgi:hypothetical protein
MAGAAKQTSDGPNLKVLGSAHECGMIKKSRIAFIISENGKPSLLRQIGSSEHRFTLAVLLEREAAILKQEAFTEYGLGAA